MNEVKVSVIVPVYNAQNFIEDCVMSILNQTFKDIELILVDDGSKDNSLEICKMLADQDERVMVFHQENGGSSSAKNAGLKIAKGDYVAFCDADDTLDNEYIENLYKGVALHNADVCVGNAAFTNVEDSKVVSRRTVNMTSGIFSLKEFMAYYPEYMPNAVIGAPWNKLYRRSIITKNSICFNTNIRNNEDTHFNYEFLVKCKTVYVSESPYYNYMNRVGVASASRNFIPNLFDIYVVTYKKAIDFLKAADSYNENILFQNQYFIGLVIGAINGIVSGKNNLSKKEKIEQIKTICSNEEVKKAIKTVNFSNRKKQIIAMLIKYKQFRLIYALISLKK